MRKILFVLIFFSHLAYPQSKSIEALRESFSDPGNAFRGKPFWAWNADLEEEELIRQIDVFEEMGMGGFFMHSRTGLETEYLGDKWFELINICTDEAEKRGMEAWIYDEDRWPSGLAGGLVTQYPEYRPRRLTVKGFESASFVPDKKYIALFSCKIEGYDIYDYKRITQRDVNNLAPGQIVLAFYTQEVDKKPFANDYTDVDRMNRAATDYFLKITHEKYKEHSGDRLGTTIPGVFIDEPHRGHGVISSGDILENEFSTAWTGVFADEFKKRMGYDLMDRLPEIFFRPDGNPVSQVKWAYMEVAQQLFLENWLIPVYQWCVENNMKLTGHFLIEETLAGQARFQGSIMRSYEYMDYPGIDVLTEGNRNYWVAKNCQSVARQMGQPFILSEIYGVTGWQFDFAGHKYAGDWQAMFGVNLRCHHLSWYTMKGQRKRDYPASIFHQSGWYTNYKYVEDYFSRINVLMSQGQEICDVLIVSPVESVWCQVNAGHELREIERRFRELFNILQDNQIDFDYGDEDIMKRHGRIVTEDGIPVLKINQASYKTVVLGTMTTIRSSTLELLKEFADAGGKIVMAGEAPAYVDALPSDQAKQLAGKMIPVDFSEEAIVGAIISVTPANVDATDTDTGERLNDIWCQLRKDEDRFIVMALNLSDELKYDRVKLRVKAEGHVTMWDCASDKLFRVDARRQDGYTVWETSFVEAQERLFTLTPQAVPSAAAKPAKKTLVSESELYGPFRYTLNEPNICVLDLGYVEIAGEGTSELKEILKADQFVRDHFGLPHRGGAMVQPWFKTKFREAPRPLGNVKISFPFYVEEIPESNIQLLLETPHEFTVTLNGTPLELNDQGWFIDIAFRLVDIPSGLLRPGENILVKEFNFRDDLELEACYLLGDFSVRLEGNKKILGNLPNTISVGDIANQGFPFYSGRIAIDIPLFMDLPAGNSMAIELPGIGAACAIVDPGTPHETMIPWHPYQADVTESFKKNGQFSLELVLTRRNTFGPLHNTPFTGTAGPRAFTTEGSNFTLNYVLFENGLLKNPVIKVFQAN